MTMDEHGRVIALAPRRRAQAVARMHELHPTEPGWRWTARAVQGAPGWWAVELQGPNRQMVIGSIHFLGPGDVMLDLSSNPWIHDFDVTRTVLAELGESGLGPEQLADEIFQRTRALRS